VGSPHPSTGHSADHPGSGIGALTNLLKAQPVEELFPNVDFPETHNTPILKAAYIFSFLT
jgi:hypothetical protein